MADFQQDKVPPETRPEGAGSAPGKAARMPGMYVRERVLIACAVLLVALFGFTAFIARQYHHTLHRYADGWFAKGEAALAAGQAKTAIDDYRNALVYKPEDPTFQFHLAQALAAAGQEDQARAYLLNLDPSSGPINLTLARIAVRQNNKADATRYYHLAIDGIWRTHPLRQRWEVRRELCEYLLDQGDAQQAEPDLIALAQDVPPQDVARRKVAGNLLIRAGLWTRALAEFRTVLASDRRDPEALAGAGKASFELGKYPQAVAYLVRLPREKRQAADVSQMLQTAQEAESMNALRTGLPASEQARRAAKALFVANARLAACAKQRGDTLPAAAGASPDALQQLYATAQQNKRVWSVASLATHPDQITAAMSYAFQVEAAAATACGAPQSAADQALASIASHRSGQNGE